MIDRNHDLPIKRQAELVGISRGSVYYLPRPVSEADLQADAAHRRAPPGAPFAGSRMLRDMLSAEGFEVGRRHVATLMRRMGIEALYRKPNTSKRHPGHKVYPVPAARAGDRARQPGLGTGHHVHPDGPRLRLPVRDRSTVASRKVLAHRVSITHGGLVLRRGARGGVRAVRQARDLQHRPGQPVHGRGVHRRAYWHEAWPISMDGEGAWRDNIFVERLWRTIKYEEVYLHAYD